MAFSEKYILNPLICKYIFKNSPLIWKVHSEHFPYNAKNKLQHKLEQSMWKFQGLINKEVEFLDVLMKKSCEFPWVLVFDLETPKGCQTIF